MLPKQILVNLTVKHYKSLSGTVPKCQSAVSLAYSAGAGENGARKARKCVEFSSKRLFLLIISFNLFFFHLFSPIFPLFYAYFVWFCYILVIILLSLRMGMHLFLFSCACTKKKKSKRKRFSPNLTSTQAIFKGSIVMRR